MLPDPGPIRAVTRPAGADLGVQPLPYHSGTLPHPGALAGAAIPWSDLQRILLVRPDNLGDVLLLGPALRALRAATPAKLTLLASPAGASVAALLPELDTVIVTSPLWQHAGPAPSADPAAQLALSDRLRDGDFDAALCFTSFSQSPYPAAYAALLAGIGIRAGMSREFGGAVLTHWLPSPTVTQHQADRSLQLLANLGIPLDPGDFSLHLALPPGTEAAARITAGLGADEDFVAVLPGASCPARRWAAASFAAAAADIASKGLPVVIAGSAGEAALVADTARRAAAATASRAARIVPLAGALDVPGLAGLLAAARAALVNNSGGMHLADATRTPVVALFAGTEYVEEYAPRSGWSRVFNRSTACTPCRAFACPYEHQCLQVDVGDVVEAVLDGVSQRREFAVPTTPDVRRC